MKKVSGKTHTKEQLDNWANQNNPNNKAYSKIIWPSTVLSEETTFFIMSISAFHASLVVVSASPW